MVTETRAGTDGVPVGAVTISTPSERLPFASFNGWVAFLTVVAAGLTWYRIGRDSFWLDEAASLRFARRSSWTHLFTVDNGNNVLYYALLKLWLPIAKSEMAIRLLSLIPFVLTVPAVGFLGRRLHRERAAVVAAALVASHPLLVRYGQEARSFSLVTLLVTTAVLALTVGTQDSRRGVFMAGVVLLGLAGYAHPIAALTGVSLVAWLCVWSRDTLPTQRIWVASAFAVVIAPLAIVIARAGSTQISWTGRGSNGGVVSLLSVIWENLSDTPAGFVVGCLAIAGCVFTVRRVQRLDRSVDAVVAGLSIVWVLGTGVLVLIASVHQSLLVPRYLLLVVPAVAILAADGAFAARAARITVTLLVVAVVLNLSVVIERGAHYRPENWRQAQRFIAAHAQLGDGILFAPTFKAVSFDYYQFTGRKVWPEPMLPSGRWGDLSVTFGKPIHDRPADLAKHADAIARHRRGWLVIARGPGGTASREFIDAAKRVFGSYGPRVQSWEFGRIRVILYR
jgi:mannosyltransferase